MRSEQAKILLSSNCNDLIWTTTAKLAVEHAEEDTRERATEAFKETCFHRSCAGHCEISYKPDPDNHYEYDAGKSCNEYCNECGQLSVFLKKYDND